MKTIRCDSCGAMSPLGAMFSHERKLFRRRRLCPACWTRENERTTRKLLRDALALAALGPLLVAVDDLAGLGWLLINATLVVVFLFLVTIPHEAGHLVAARLVGAFVPRVMMGAGPLLYERRIFGTTWEMHALPGGGITLWAPATGSGLRAQIILVTLAGPLANFALLGMAVATNGASVLSIDHVFSRPLIWEAFAWANAAILVANLIPFRPMTLLGRANSDGMALLTVPFLREEQARDLVVMRDGLLAAEHRRAGRLEAALAVLEDGLARHPDHPILRNDLAVSLMDLMEFERAAAIFRSLAYEDESQPERLALFKNNLAYANALSRREDLLAEADALSTEAFGILPWVAAVQGTRGAVLVEMGRLDEGVELLEAAAARTTDPRDKAAVLCSLARARELSGDAEGAAQYERAARSLNPRCPLLPPETGLGHSLHRHAS